MPSFVVTNEIISEIVNQYNVSKKMVENLHEFYVSFVVDMKKHYLAHIIRTMEERLRTISGNAMFRIVCSPVDVNTRVLGIARAQYFKNRYFAIYYHPNTDEKQLRVQIAHELGHLFLIEMVNSQLNKQYNENTGAEPYASILGIFAILDKNEFYHNMTAPFKHNSPDEVLNDFKLMINRNKGILNTSQSMNQL